MSPQASEVRQIGLVAAGVVEALRFWCLAGRLRWGQWRIGAPRGRAVGGHCFVVGAGRSGRRQKKIDLARRIRLDWGSAHRHGNKEGWISFVLFSRSLTLGLRFVGG